MNHQNTFTALTRSKPFLFILPILAFSACGGPEEAGYGEMPPPAVTAIVVQSEDVAVRAHYAGRIRGAREVEVRARVGGIVEERLYAEGGIVEQGEALFQIETEPYQIALQQAEAEEANARASLNQAEREWKRISRLYEQDAVSERERDRALSEFELAEARLKSAEARRAEAELNLGYTLVRAPISGPTGLESLPEGSLIERGTLLTRIVQQDPVHALFSVPENDASIQRALRQAKGNGNRPATLEARLVMADGSQYEAVGEVDFTDSTIDPRTGTVSLRAIFPNPEGVLIPGQFVRVEMLLQEYENAFRIDPTVVGQGPEGPRLFVVSADNTAEVRAVRLGPVVDGKQVVLSGLGSGDRVVVNGHVALQHGMPVSVQILEREAE